MTFAVGDRVRVNDNYDGLWNEIRGHEGVITYIQHGVDEEGPWTLYKVEVCMGIGMIRKAMAFEVDIESPMLAAQTQDLINLIESLGG